MDSIKQIAVLMRKKNIEDGVSIYFPDHIISGFIYKSDEDYDDDDDNYGEETIFSDDFGEDYLLMDDPRSTFSEEDVVWHCISESDLLEKYEGLNKDEAVVRYFSDISSSIFVGFYHYARQKTIFISLNFDNLYTYLNDQVIDENFQKTILNPNNLASYLFEKYEEDEEKFNTYDDIQNPSIEAYNFISIDADVLKQLLSLTGEELKEKISTIYESYKQISEYNNTPDYEKILEKANDIYQKILSIDDIDKIKQVCSNLEDMYMEIAESLDNKYKFSNDNVKDEIENFVFKAIDICHSMSKYDDINDIKKTLSSFRDRQITHFEAMKNKQKEREKRQQELEEAFYSEDKILEEENDLLFNPKEMKAFLDKRIIGQEEAKKDVTSAIFMNSLAEESISKNTCLLVGPTGSGKTLIASSVAEFLNLPIVNIDTTQLTVPGYVGANIEDFLTRLIESANGNVEKAQKGIVILDEIDKKGSKSNGDVSGKGVLNTLLPFVQGTTYTVPYNHRKVSFDSSNLTIFMTGAFTDVAKGVNEKSLYNDSKIGFGTNRENTKGKEDIVYKKLNIEDFVEHGDFPVELVGRISNIVQLSGHTKESLKSILTDSNISVLKLEEEKLKKLNVEVKYNDDYLDRVAEKALSLKTGARSLKSTVEESIKEARWEVITASDQFKAIVLNKDCVDNNLKAILVYNDDNYTTVEDLRNKEEEKAVEKVKK